MAPDADDLEQALRQNLKLRRELGAEAAKAGAALGEKQGGGVARRLGRTLYWASLILAVAWLTGFSLAAFNSPAGPAQVLVPITFAFIFVPALGLYGLGRAFRYILSGE